MEDAKMKEINKVGLTYKKKTLPADEPPFNKYY